MARDLSGSSLSSHPRAARKVGGRAFFADFWDYVPLALTVRVLLVILVAAAGVIESSLRLMGDVAGGWQEYASSMLTTLCILLMLWRPPAAAVAFIAVGFIALTVGEGGGYLTALTASVGLVLYACSTSFALLFCAAVAAWIVAMTLLPPGLPTGGVVTLLVIALLSAAIGRGARMIVRRNVTLRRELDFQDERLEAELKAERTRIADELHDVIAHDIAIVAMHAQVLERTDDAEIRSTSQRAISEAARQALADTRRILHLIHGQVEEPSTSRTQTIDIRTALSNVADELRALGDDVDLSMAEGPPLAKSIDSALVRMARESVMNIIKHASSPRTATLALTFSRETVTLLVANSPHRAGTPSLASSGFGLARLKERAELLGGHLSVGLGDDVWSVRMTLPQR